MKPYMATTEHGDMLQSTQDSLLESITQIESSNPINNYEELSYFEQSQKCGTYQTNSNISFQYENQTGNLTDEPLRNFLELPLTDPLPSEATCYGGLLLVWGCGEFGQHGHGHTEDVPRHYALEIPLWLGHDRTVTEVSCGSSHTMVLTDDNKVYSWGNSNSGQLGTGDTETCPHPRSVHLGVSLGTKLKGITCGTRHSFVWTQDGDCFSFGNNYSGQLGYDFRKPDFKENQLRPVFVDTLLRRPVSQVACGSRHSIFLFTNGQVAAVGVNNRGQIGCGDTVDVVCAKTIPEIPPVSVIACGNSHTLAADVYGHVYAWGYGKACGFKTDVLSPLCVYSCTKHDKLLDMAGGDSHSLILLSSGTIYSWGNNFEGQLGQGKSVKFVSHPRELCFSLLPGKVTNVSVGENTCAAVTDDGKLYMWGKNSNNVIRDDENGRFFQFEPHLVSLGVWKALKVSCGSWHVACVVFAAQKHQINEADQEISETARIIANSELDTDLESSVCSVCETNGKQLLEEEEFAITSANDPPREEGFPINFNKEEENIFANSLIVGEENEAEDASLEPFDSSKDYCVETQHHRETDDNSTAEEFNSKADPDVDTKTEIIGDVTRKTSTTGVNNTTINLSFEEKPTNLLKERTHSDTSEEIKEKSVVLLKERTYSDTNEESKKKPVAHSEDRNYSGRNEGISEEKPSDIDTLLKAAEDDTERPALIDKIPRENSGDEPGPSKEQKRPNVNLNQLANEQEHCVPKEEKVAIERQPNAGLFTRTRALSEQASNKGYLGGSLDSITVLNQQDSKGRASRSSRDSYSPPANPRNSVGHLTREKRAPRMLRQASFDMEYQLPNQPVHTVDIGMSPSVLRQGYPSMNRTQSSPTLYSSNLIRSPLSARKKSSLGNKVPRPPKVSTGTDDSLPPRPQARGIRRSLEFNPMFSSGTSWRKR